MANGSRTACRLVGETVYGTTPATPTLRHVRYRPTLSLGLKKTSFTSEEIRDDRQLSDFRHGNYDVSGDVPYEVTAGGTHDDLMEAVLCGTWTADVLQAGVTRRSFTFQKFFGDLESGDPYHNMPGCEINTWNLEAVPNAMVKQTFGVVGRDFQPAAAQIAGATVEGPTTTSPMDAFSGALLEGGSPIAVVTGIKLTLDNGIETRFVIGSPLTIRPSIGRSMLSGEITAYFEDSSLMNKFKDELESDLTITLADKVLPTPNSYTIFIPRLKYGSGSPDVQNEKSLMLTMSFQALYDSVEGSNITVTRVLV